MLRTITGIKNRIVSRAQREQFFPTPFLGMALNPVYIARAALHKAIANVAPAITGSILDFGCGSKPYASLFVNATEYTGVDIKASGHDHNKLSSKVDFFYDGKSLPFEDGTFDAVVTFEVLEHVFNLAEILEELRRVIRPGGTLLISIPFAWYEHEQPYDFARYTSFGITSLLERHNFSQIQVTKTTSFFLAICQMQIAYLAYFLFPTTPFVRRILQLTIIFPLTAISVAINTLLPKRSEYFCQSVITAVARPV